jgi:hypothetical protein
MNGVENRAKMITGDIVMRSRFFQTVRKISAELRLVKEKVNQEKT